MKYKIIVDKQSRTNPSYEKKEYIIDIEELRTNGTVSDTLVITKDEDYVMRRLELTEYHLLKVLNEPIKEPFEDVDIELFDGDNYIYLVDMVGNKFYAEYIVKNDLTEMYATKLELTTAINQTSEEIQLLADKKLDKDEFSTELAVNSEAVKVAWNKISEYLQMEVINKNASLAIRDEAEKLLMALDKFGQHFYNGDYSMDIGAFNCYFPTYDSTYQALMFVLNEKATNNFMGWGYKTVAENGDVSYIPVIYLGGNSESDYGFHVDNDLFLGFNAIRFKNSKIYDNNDSFMFEIGEDIFWGDTRDGTETLSIYRNTNGTKTVRFFGDIDTPVMIDNLGRLVMANGNIFLNNDGYIDCLGLNQTSLLSKKKNLERFYDGLNIIRATDIYKYNFKSENEGDKKHIGFVIGDKYNYSKEITSKNNDGVELYSMISVAYKAIQEQQEQIEQLQEKDKQKDEIITNLIKRIEALEKEVNNNGNS